MMTDEMVRKDFIEKFVPGAKVVSSQLLGTALNATHSYKDVEKQADDTEKLRKQISKSAKIDLQLDGKSVSSNLSQALRALTGDKDYFLRLFTSLRDSKLDVVCEVEYEDAIRGTVLAEVQVIPPDYSWDARALYYAASVFARQLRRGDEYDELKNVVGINILGGENREGSVIDWSTRFIKGEVRHYRFVDDKGNQIRPGIELIQYPIFLLKGCPQVDQTWIKLLTSAHEQGEEVFEDTSLTPAIRKAYDLLAERNMPKFLRDLYYMQRKYLSRSSDDVAIEVAKGKAEGKAEGEAKGEARGLAQGEARERTKAHQAKLESARGLLVAGTSPELVANSLKLPLDEVMRIVETKS